MGFLSSMSTLIGSLAILALKILIAIIFFLAIKKVFFNG